MCKALIVLAFFAVTLSCQAAINGKEYFVSPKGGDSASGSKSTPWKTIQHAAKKAVPGSTVYIKAGVYKEKICMEVSGAKDKWITFKPYAKDKVLIDASGITQKVKSKTKEVEGDGIIYISKSNYIRIQGLEIANAKLSDGSGIRIYGSADHIELLGNHIHDLCGKSAMGITLYGSDKRKHTGIHNVLIQGNHIHDCEPATSETLVVNGYVTSFKILNNHVHHVNNIGIDAIGGEKWLSTKYPSHGVIANNWVHHCFSSYEDGYAAGIYSDGCSNLLIENNAVSECDLGIEIGAENKGVIVTDVIVRGNVVFNNYKAGIGFGGYDKKKTGCVKGVVIEDNVFYKNNRPKDKGPYPMSKGAKNGEIWVQWSIESQVRGNIICANKGVNNMRISWDKGYDERNIFESNTYYTEDGQNKAVFVSDGKEFDNFKAYQKSGLEKKPVFKDPKLSTQMLEKKAQALLDGNK